MRRNPHGDWTIEDVERLCKAHGFGFAPPTGGGSHYKVTYPGVPGILTIPYRRPIKPFYVKLLVEIIDRLSEDQ